MKVELAGPYADIDTGRVVNDDLERIALSRHPVAAQSPTGRLCVGHGSKKTCQVVIYYPGLTDKERAEIAMWAQELLRERINQRADSASAGPASVPA